MDSATNNNSYLVSMNSYTTSKAKVKDSKVSSEQQYPNLLMGGEKRKAAYEKGGAVGPNLL